MDLTRADNLITDMLMEDPPDFLNGEGVSLAGMAGTGFCFSVIATLQFIPFFRSHDFQNRFVDRLAERAFIL